MVDELHATVAQRLKAIDQRYTPGRRQLVEMLDASGGPRSLPELLAAGAGPQSSAYRHVAVLEQAGVVHRIAGTGDHARFELAEDLTEHHHHLVCTSCGAVADVALPPAVEQAMAAATAAVEAATGFLADAHRLDLVGTCADCR